MKETSSTPERVEVLRLKEAKLLDLIRRACANGTAREVAAAIAFDWIPTIEIDGNGKASVIVPHADERNERSESAQPFGQTPRTDAFITEQRECEGRDYAHKYDKALRFARQIELELAEDCEDCDHGIRGGEVCQSCKGSGRVLIADLLSATQRHVKELKAKLEAIEAPSASAQRILPDCKAPLPTTLLLTITGGGEWYCNGCGASNLEPTCRYNKDRAPDRSASKA